MPARKYDHWNAIEDALPYRRKPAMCNKELSPLKHSKLWHCLEYPDILRNTFGIIEFFYFYALYDQLIARQHFHSLYHRRLKPLFIGIAAAACSNCTVYKRLFPIQTSKI